MEFAPLYLLFIVLWALCLWQAWDFGRLGRLAARQAQEPQTAHVPPLSVVLTCQNEAERLRRLLPVLLEQQYPTDFEVIVVDMCSTDETRDLLEHFAYTYPHLHQTHLPASARDISLSRMAMTLGLKAAANKWIVFLGADCLPADGGWLRAVALTLDENRDASVTPMRYREPSGWLTRKAQFLRLWRQMRWLPKAERRPYSAEGCVLCYRRSHFIQHRGFASSQALQVGAETLLLNHHVSTGRCALNLRPEALLTQEPPSARKWHGERTFFVETWHHMKHGWLIHMTYVLQVAAQWLFPAAAVAMLALLWRNAYVTAAVCVLWLGLIALRLTMLRLTARQLRIKPFGFSLPLLLYAAPIWEATDWLRWRLTDKKTFRKNVMPSSLTPQPLSEERGVNSK